MQGRVLPAFQQVFQALVGLREVIKKSDIYFGHQFLTHQTKTASSSQSGFYYTSIKFVLIPCFFYKKEPNKTKPNAIIARIVNIVERVFSESVSCSSRTSVGIIF